MAQATHTPAVTRTEVVEVKPACITLELSNDEAVTLATLLVAVSGHNRSSLRKNTDAIFKALSTAGVRWSQAQYETMSSRPYFKESSL